MGNSWIVVLSLMVTLAVCDQRDENLKIILGNGEKTNACGSNQECVPRQLCNDGQINKDGGGLFTIRMGDSQQPCPYLRTCCSLSEKTNTSFITFEQPSVGSNGCGHWNPEGVGARISGGKHNESQFGEFPWMVSIWRRRRIQGTDELDITMPCGGSLITPSVILTAAHCVRFADSSALTVRAGDWDIETDDEFYGYQERNVTEKILHEAYNVGTLYNDVALLILTEPFELAAHIKPICLPDTNDKFDNVRCFATGWGKDKYGPAGFPQHILKKLVLPVVPSEQCQQNMRKSRNRRLFRLHESFICAGGEEGIDTCQGDGGSPLVCPIPNSNGRYVQAGIVAYGTGCGEKDVSAFYANVANLKPWISKKLADKNIDQSYFTFKV